MLNLSQSALLLGSFLLICNFVDLKVLKRKVEYKVKEMKFDPDWINFILGSTLLLFGMFFVVFFVENAWKDFSGSF